MKEQIDKVIDALGSSRALSGETDEFTRTAQQIAVVALADMRGPLLHKALAVAEAIAAFSDELSNPS